MVQNSAQGPQSSQAAATGQSASAMGHMNNASNQNRKLTPSKGTIGLRANSALNNSNNIAQNLGRNYEKQSGKQQKVNGRSNTIEVPPQEKESRKNVKRKERTSQSSIDGLWNKNGKPVSQITSFNNQRQLQTVMNNYQPAQNFGQSQQMNSGTHNSQGNGGSLNKLPMYNNNNYSMH